MIADKQRILRPGTEYNALIPRSAGKTRVLRNGADTDDTISTVKSVVRSTLAQTARLAPTLKGRDLRATCSRIWHWVYQHIQYKNDEPGYEQVRHPARIWADRKRGVDCDDYTTIVSSILLNLGIPHKLRVTDYGRGWQHIYVVVPVAGQLTRPLDQDKRSEYIVIDCVPNQFDHEVRYTRKMDIPMQLQVLSGLDGVPGPDYGIDGTPDPQLGNIFKKIGGAFKKAGDAVAKVAKKVVASPVRAGVLVFMKLNVKQGASRLRWGYLTSYNQQIADAGYGPKAYEQIRNSLKKLQNTYVSLGGRADALRGAILNSSGNKDKAVPVDSPDVAGLGRLAAVDPDWAVAMQINSLESPIPNVAGLEGVRPDGLGAAPAVALIAAATPIIIPILNMIGKVRPNDPGDPVPDEYLPDDTADAPDAPEAATDVEPTQPDPAVDGLGAVAKKKAKKVAAVVAKKKPHLVAKATAVTVKRAGGTPVGKSTRTSRPTAKPAAKPVASSAAAKKAAIKRVVAIKRAKHKPGVAAGAATAAAVTPFVSPLLTRPVAVPDSTLPALPAALPTQADESGAEQVVMPAVVTAKPATTKKQGLLNRIFTKKGKKPGKATPPAKAARPAQPARATRPAPVVTAAPVSVDSDDELTPAVTSRQVTTAITQTTQAAAQVIKNKKVADLLRRTGKVSQAAQQAADAAAQASDSMSTDVAPTSDDAGDAGVVDLTAETGAQAATDVATAAPAPTPPGFFQDSQGKADLLKIGAAGALAFVLGKMLFSDSEAPPRPPRKSGSSPKPLSGTPAKKSRKRASKRRSRSSGALAGTSMRGLEPVALS